MPRPSIANSLAYLGILILAGVLGAAKAHAEGAAPTFTLEMEKLGRIQNQASSSRLRIDIEDPEIYSPKSVRFSADGRKIYINSLEGGKTVIYSWPGLKKQKTISHRFRPADAALFGGVSTLFDYQYYAHSPAGDPNVFMGKPVESELTHRGRWLWIPYYRRDFDESAQSPSAVAIIDTNTDRIVRVMPTGPIPKYVVASPDGNYVAIINWGDNTVGLIDTHSSDPRDFQYVAHLTVENQLSQEGLAGTDRDSTCGFCLRGSVFTPDSQYLIVGRMGKGGIAGFHIPTRTYLGSIMNIESTPRHLVISPDGQTLFVSSNYAGYISKAPLANVVGALIKAKGARVGGPRWNEVFVGEGARTLDISHDGRVLFVAVNNSAELVAVDAQSLKVISRISVDPYAVGLAVAPDDSAVILTSQGHSGHGGNAANIIGVKIRTGPPPGTLN